MANVTRPLTAKEWKWGTTSEFKSENLLVSSDALTIYRIDGGSNPAGLTTSPFTRANKTFRVKVDRLGSWIGIGLAEKTFKNEGSDPLGMQKGVGLNACLWWSTTSKGVFLAGGASINMTDDVQAGDEIAVEIDFDASKIHFWLNTKYIAFVTSPDLPTLENHIFPCANLSCATNVTILPDKASGWKWNPLKKGPNLALSENDLQVTRTTEPGRNPAILATEPLTPARNHFRARIIQLGTWVGIGVADANLQITDGSTLGTQGSCVNCGYFWQNSGIRRISCIGETTLDAPDAKQNDILDVIVYFEDSQVMFWLNEKHIGTMKCNKFTGMEGKLYPCCNLSTDTTILFVNDPIGPLPNQKVYDDYSLYWRWDSKRKSSVLNLADGGLSVARTTGGSNPAALSMNPLTPQHNHVRFKLTEVGGWVGVGFADNSCVVDGGSTVGSQSGVNCTYFWQDSGLHKVQMNGESSIQVDDLAVGDIVDMLLDFSTGKIYFWLNKKYQTCMISKSIIGNEGKLFAAANLSTGTTVSLINGEKAPPLPDAVKKSESIPDLAVAAQSTAKWVWNAQLKSNDLQLSKNGLELSRQSSGSNPAAYVEAPLSKENPMFRMRLANVGSWIAVDNDSVLGSQSQCFNSGLFYQDNCAFVCSKQNACEPSQRFEKLATGMTVDFLLDFAECKVHVYIDGAFHSTTPIASLKEYEGKLYPLAQISASSKVILVDDTPDPKLLLASLNRSQATFRWDKKSANLNVNDTGLVLSRVTGGSNPAAISTTPLNADRNHFRVRIDQMGSWIGIGFAEESFQLDGGSVIGSQSGINGGFFWQGGNELVPNLEAGAIIDIMVDFTKGVYHQWLDGRYLEEKKLSKLSSMQEKVFPVGQLSAGTTISLITDVKPNLKIGNETAEDSTEWKWSTEKSKKSDFTTVGRNGLSIARATGGSNSAGFATAPLTKALNSFRVKIDTMGTWVGVGVAEATFQIEGGAVIGKQTAFSVGLFQQSRCSLRRSDKIAVDMTSVATESLIDMLVDFDNKKIHCFIDQTHAGVLECPELADLEGKIFPVAQLAAGTSVSLVNGSFQLAIPQPKQEEKKGEASNTAAKTQTQVNELEEIIAKYSVPSAPFPTQWSWSSDKQRKASVLEVSDNNLEVSRNSSSGSNPALFANMPFTKNSYYFKVKIVALGGWIGIGVADTDFVVVNSSTLGSQVASFNSGYFFQGASHKIQTNNSHSITAAPLKGAGDIICVKINFDEKKIYYFLNGALLGAYEDTTGQVKEGHLFPVANLSLGTTVEIINVAHEDAEAVELVHPSTPSSSSQGRLDTARDKEAPTKTGLEIQVTVYLGEQAENHQEIWDPTATIDDCCRELAGKLNMLDMLPYFALWSPHMSRWLKPKSKLLLYDWKGKTNVVFQQRYKPLKVSLPDGITYLIKVEMHLTVDEIVESLKKQLFELTEQHFSLKDKVANRFLTAADNLKDLPDNCMLVLEKKQFNITFDIPSIEEQFSMLFSYDAFVSDVKAGLVAKYELHPKVSQFKEDSWKLFYPGATGTTVPFYLNPNDSLHSLPPLEGTTLQFRRCKRTLKFQFPTDDDVNTSTIAGVEVDESKTLGEIILELSQELRFDEPNCYAFQVKIDRWAEWMDNSLTLFQNILMAQNDRFSLFTSEVSQSLVYYLEKAAEKNEIILLLKKRLLHAADPAVVASARPKELRRLYLTTVDAVLDGRLPLSKEDAFELAAIKIMREEYINIGLYTNMENKICNELIPENYLPYVWRRNRGFMKEVYNYFKDIQAERWRYGNPSDMEKDYITKAHQNKAFGFSCTVSQSFSGGEIKKYQCGITADSILLINPKTQATISKFDIVHLKRWAATVDSIILDFGNHDPGVLSLDTNEASEISSVLDGYVNIMRDTEKFRQLAKFAIRGDESAKIKQKKLNPILVNFKNFNPSMPEDEKAVILHEAIRTGNPAFVETILEKVSPNVNHYKHYTKETRTTIQAAIHIAVELNFVDIVRLLHNNKANLNQVRTVKLPRATITETPLHIALNLSVSERYHAMAELLLELGADTKIMWKRDEGQTIHTRPPLAFAVDNSCLPLAQKLLKYGAELNQCVESSKLGIQIRRESCLHIAASKDTKGEIVSLLLENDITVDFTRYARIENGEYAWQEENSLHIAVRKKNYVVTEMLLKHYVDRNLDPFKTFRKYERNNFYQQLTGEAIQSSISDKGTLNWNGNDVAAQNNKTKETALHIAVDVGDVEMLNLVLKYGANTLQPRVHQYRDVKSYEWPLHIAAELGHTQIVDILINTRGMNVDVFKICESESSSTILKETALHIATMKGYPEIVDKLLAKGADIDLHRENREKHATALWLALSSYDELQTELATKHFGHKTKEYMENQKGNFSVIIESLMDAGAVIHGENLPGQDSKQSTPLLLITYRNMREFVDLPQVREEIENYWYPKDMRYHWRTWQYWKTLVSFKVPKYRFMSEFTVFALMLALLTTVMLFYSTRNDTGTYYYNQSIRELIVNQNYDIGKTFYDINSEGEFWQWSTGPMADGFFGTSFVNRYVFVVGNVTLRQLRTQPHDCSQATSKYEDWTLEEGCFAEYAPDTADKAPFGPSGNKFEYTKPKYLEFYSQYVDNYYPIWGGFVQSFDPRSETADGVKTRLEFMQNSGWIDSHSSAIVFETMLFNGNMNLFSFVRMTFEIPPAGPWIKTAEVVSTRMFYYQTKSDMLILTCEIIVLILFISFVITEFREMRDQKIRYFYDLWNYLELCIYFVFFGLIVLRIVTIGLAYSLSYPPADDEEKAKYFYVGAVQSQEWNWMAVLGILYWVKLLKYLRLFKRIGILLRVMFLMLQDVFTFLVIFFVIDLGFSLGFHVIAGQYIYQARSWERCFFTMLRMIFGDFDWEEVEATNRYFLMALFFVHIIVSGLLLLNLLIAMFGQSYSRVADQSEQEYLLERAKISLSYSSDFRSKLKKQENQMEIPTKEKVDVVIDELPQTMDEIAKKVFSMYDKKDTGQIPFDQLKNFVSDFIVEYSHLTANVQLKVNIPLIQKDAANALENKSFITLRDFLKWCKSKKEDFDQSEATTFQQSTFQEDFVSFQQLDF